MDVCPGWMSETLSDEEEKSVWVFISIIYVSLLQSLTSCCYTCPFTSPVSLLARRLTVWNLSSEWGLWLWELWRHSAWTSCGCQVCYCLLCIFRLDVSLPHCGVSGGQSTLWWGGGQRHVLEVARGRGRRPSWAESSPAGRRWFPPDWTSEHPPALSGPRPTGGQTGQQVTWLKTGSTLGPLLFYTDQGFYALLPWKPWTLLVHELKKWKQT